MKARDKDIGLLGYDSDICSICSSNDGNAFAAHVAGHSAGIDIDIDIDIDRDIDRDSITSSRSRKRLKKGPFEHLQGAAATSISSEVSKIPSAEPHASDNSSSDDDSESETSHWPMQVIRTICPETTIGEDGNVQDCFLEVEPSVMYDDLKCPICLGYLERTWAVMACLHRFCSDCMHRALRADLGPNKTSHECPSCRIKLPSRRSSNPDILFDCIVAHLRPNSSYAPVELATSAGTEDQTRSHGGDQEEWSPGDVAKFQAIHQINVERFRQQQAAHRSASVFAEGSNESHRFPTDHHSTFGRSASSDSNGHSNLCHTSQQSSLVAFSLTPWPIEASGSGMPANGSIANFRMGSLKCPYLTVPVELKVHDLKLLLLQSKSSIAKRGDQLSTCTINTTQDLEIGIQLGSNIKKRKIKVLGDSLTMFDVCVQIWDGSGPMMLHYRHRSHSTHN